MALRSWGSRFTGGGLAFAMAPTILVLGSSAFSSSTPLRPHSTAATMWAVGTLLGGGAKLSPFCHSAYSDTDSDLEDRLTTHLGCSSESLLWDLCACSGRVFYPNALHFSSAHQTCVSVWTCTSLPLSSIHPLSVNSGWKGHIHALTWPVP